MTVYYLDAGLQKLQTVAVRQGPEEFSKTHLHYRGVKGIGMNSDKLIYSVLRVCVCACASEAGTGADVGTGMVCVCMRVCRFRYAFVLWIRVCVVEQLLARAWNVCMCVCTYGMCVHDQCMCMLHIHT